MCSVRTNAWFLRKRSCSFCERSNGSNKFNWISKFAHLLSEIQATPHLPLFFLFKSSWLQKIVSLIVISKVSPFENVDVVPEGEPFTLTNTYLKAHFSDQGLLQVSTKHIRKYCAKLSIFQLSVHSQHNTWCLFIFQGHNHNGGQCKDGDQDWIRPIWNSKQRGQERGLPFLARCRTIKLYLFVDMFAILESNVFLQMNQCISSDNSRYIILQMAREKFVMSAGLLSGWLRAR